jgi:hypothetical protein
MVDLPNKIAKPSRINPKRLIIFSQPKTGDIIINIIK